MIFKLTIKSSCNDAKLDYTNEKNHVCKNSGSSNTA